MDTEDNYFGDQDDMELEQIIEGRADVIEDDENDDNRERGDDEAIEAPSRKKKDDADDGKKKRVIAPRPKLDSVRLNSNRGLLALEAEMKGIKLRGRGHELEDLDLIMGRMQHWCHRLFPSYTFDDCLDKLEKLGAKKGVSVQVKRIRMGLVSVEDAVDTTIRGDTYVADEEAPAPRLAPVVEPDPDAAFNELMASTQPTAASTPAPKPAGGLTEEQKARMLRNRLAAEERRLARLKEQREEEERKRAEEAALAELAELEEAGM